MKLRALESTVSRALEALGAPCAGDTLVVALSGGADSVALADVLATLSRRKGFRLVAAHLDHGLRPESGEDVAFCASLSRSLGIEFRAHEADIRARARREHCGLEDAARRERYAYLRRVCAEEGAAAIAVAHTRDDQAETLLLRLLRGAGATGLSAMRPRNGDVIRPLLAGLAPRGATPPGGSRPGLARGSHQRRPGLPAEPGAPRALAPARGALQPAAAGDAGADRLAPGRRRGVPRRAGRGSLDARGARPGGRGRDRLPASWPRRRGPWLVSPCAAPSRNRAASPGSGRARREAARARPVQGALRAATAPSRWP